MKSKRKAATKKKPTKKAKGAPRLEVSMDEQEASLVIAGLVKLPLTMDDPLFMPRQNLYNRLLQGAQALANNEH
jgi:hypothetical protein